MHPYTRCSPSLQISREDSQLSFQRLLSVADPESTHRHTPLSGGVGGVRGGDKEEEVARLQGELAKASNTIQRLGELLRESEGATVRLGDQAKLLKEEIRRLERNREREERVSNMEYLKNVVLKVWKHSSD